MDVKLSLTTYKWPTQYKEWMSRASYDVDLELAQLIQIVKDLDKRISELEKK